MGGGVAWCRAGLVMSGLIVGDGVCWMVGCDGGSGGGGAGGWEGVGGDGGGEGVRGWAVSVKREFGGGEEEEFGGGRGVNCRFLDATQRPQSRFHPRALPNPFVNRVRNALLLRRRRPQREDHFDRPQKEIPPDAFPLGRARVLVLCETAFVVDVAERLGDGG